MISFEVPRTLPVAHLSHSGLKLYYQCPLKWYRKYVERVYEPGNGNMLVGKAVGSGVSAGYVLKLMDKDYGQAMLDTTSDVVDEVMEHEEIVLAEDETAGTIKDTAIRCVGTYHDHVTKQFEPVTVEEAFQIDFPEAEWFVKGYIDITGSAPGFGADLHDLKVVGKADYGIDADAQATLYVASRFVRDGSLPGYAWHQLKKPTVKNPPHVQLFETTRTAVQITTYMSRIAQVAREIEWRFETGNWQGAVPGSWWCSQKYCGYWNTCPYGGVR